MQSYRQDFWIIVGTAAPVVLLALIVLIPHFGETWNQALQEITDRDRLIRIQLDARLGQLTVLVSCVLALAALTCALISTSREHDFVPRLISAVLLLAAIVGLIFAGIVEYIARAVANRVPPA